MAKKILYLDCPAGISGDMFLAAMIDMGVDAAAIKKELKKLPVKDYTITVKKETRHSITGTRFKVSSKETRRHRTYKDIKGLIEKSRLSAPVKKLSIEIFKHLAIAEGKVHGITPARVHFHEVGAVDSIVDIVGAAIAVTSLGPIEVKSSAVAVGSGQVSTMHGVMPIPAPATLELLKGIPTAPSPVEKELTTPTGAAILKTLVSKDAGAFGAMPPMIVKEAGYGVGGYELKEAPNILRAVIGTPTKDTGADGADRATVIETSIDDMNPQLAPYLIEKLIAAGALDAYYTPVHMKKGRPGLLLTAVSEEGGVDGLIDIIFHESTTIGVRTYSADRRRLERNSVKVRTRFGTVSVKVATLRGKVVNAEPEFEECRRVAEKKKVPLKDVLKAALKAFNLKK